MTQPLPVSRPLRASPASDPHREVQGRYASRIKARLAQPAIDVRSARDGMLDCFVSTYHAGLSAGVKGILGIDASEAQVARVARNMFRKRLASHGASFEEPTVSALDAIKSEVDDELHFEELPAELRGVHDQVCSLLLAKAEGTMGHSGRESAVRARAPVTPPAKAPPRPPRVPKGASSISRATAAQASSEPESNTIDTDTTPAPIPTGAVTDGIRAAIRSYVDEFQAALGSGESAASLAERVSRLERLVGTLREFDNPVA